MTGREEEDECSRSRIYPKYSIFWIFEPGSCGNLPFGCWDLSARKVSPSWDFPSVLQSEGVVKQDLTAWGYSQLNNSMDEL